jgi:hypothetical protein
MGSGQRSYATWKCSATYFDLKTLTAYIAMPPTRRMGASWMTSSIADTGPPPPPPPPPNIPEKRPVLEAKKPPPKAAKVVPRPPAKAPKPPPPPGLRPELALGLEPGGARGGARVVGGGRLILFIKE